MRFSASQIDNYLLCARKWWLSSRLRLPRVQKGSLLKGTVLHNCCERFLKGKEPFIEGWEIDPETNEKLEPRDAQLIKILIEQAIDSGYLESRPGSQVEEWFTLRIDEDTTIQGKKDHEIMPTRVEDHKTSKNKRYLKSRKALKKTLQMLVYAYELLVKVRRTGQLEPPVIELVHNQFVLSEDEPLVKQTIAEVTPKEIEDFWNTTVLPTIARMKKTAEIKDGWEIEDPEAKSCNAFGGCEYMSLCTGQEDPLTYAKRIGNMTGKKVKINMANTLDGFLGSRREKAPPAGPATVNPPADNPADTVLAQQEGDVSPPWYSTKCARCKQQGKAFGFNLKKKSLCRICLGVTRVDASDFQYTIQEGGSVLWWKKGEKKPVGELAAPETKDAGTKSLYTNEDLYTELKATKTIDDVMPLYDKAVEVFGLEETPDGDIFEAAMEKRLEELANVPENTGPGRSDGELAQSADATADSASEVAGSSPAPASPLKRKRRTKAEMAAARVAEAEVPTSQTTCSGGMGLTTPAPQEAGIMLLINCSLVNRTFPGRQLQFVEELLGDIEGYWQQDVWERRANIQQAFCKGSDVLKALNGRVIVQIGASPDGDNLISTLLPHASVVIQGSR